jgi:serine/threonine protein kinase
MRDYDDAHEGACKVRFHAMSLQGRILGGRYALGSMLGAGGMANVYKATDRVLQRTVAVKVLHFPYDRDPAFVTRFEWEARTAAALSHPNIVAVFDTGSDDDLHYIVMEYVEGEDLAAMMDREGRLVPATAGQIAWSVCQALAAAHARGLVHRDIKPANIIVSQDGVVKVTDFGIAKAIAATTAGLTRSGPVLGTASYMSPEQAQGRRVDERSDLYSLGCVLYELLTGRPPFVNDTAIGVIFQHVAEDPEPLAERSDIEVGLAKVIGRALAKQPVSRYQTAQARGDDLERVVAGLVPAVVPSSHPSGDVHQRPRPSGVLGLPATAATGAAGAAFPRRAAGWALLAGLAVVAVLLAVLLRDLGSPAGERQVGALPTIPPASTLPPATTSPVATTLLRTTTSTARPSTTTLPRSTTSATSSKPPASTQLSLPAALANLTEVLTAGTMEGSVSAQAYDDLVHKAQDVVAALQDGNVGEAQKKLGELEEKTDGFIANGEIGPAAADRVRQAVAEFGKAAERSMALLDDGG